MVFPDHMCRAHICDACVEIIRLAWWSAAGWRVAPAELGVLQGQSHSDVH